MSNHETMKAEIARLRDELAETKRTNEKNTEEAAKRAAIGTAMARAQIKDPNKIYDAIAAQVVLNHDGRWVAAENGVSRFGPDEGYTYSIDRLVADLAGSPAAPEKAASTSVAVDPGKPGFNLTAALVAARSDPHLYSELMDRLAPKPMRVS